MKLALKIVGFFFLFLLLVFGGFVLFMTSGLKSAQIMAIQPIAVTQIEDGVYEGTYGKGRWANAVDVTVKDGAITDIQVKKTVTFEKPEMTSALIEKVIDKQNIDVDLVSGATATSKSYLKSIEDALTK